MSKSEIYMALNIFPKRFSLVKDLPTKVDSVKKGTEWILTEDLDEEPEARVYKKQNEIKNHFSQWSLTLSYICENIKKGYLEILE